MKTLTVSGLLFFLIPIHFAFATRQLPPDPVVQMPYKDSELGCSDRADADRYVADFRIDVKSFGGMELCDSKVDTKKLLNDIHIVEKGVFDANKANPLIKNFVDSNQYYAWLQQQTRGVERGNDIPYATAYNTGGFFTMQDGWSKASTLGRVGVFVHEARHTAGYMHIVCTQGTYQGTRVNGCDRDYSYGGSHAVEMEYYARVTVQGVNFHPVYKKMARLMAMARSNIFFNTTPLQTREGVLALPVGGKQAVLFDRGQWVPREVPDSTGKLKRTSFGAVIFDGMKALAIDMYQNSGFADAIDDTYSYYKLLIENKKSTKDFEEYDQGTKRYVVHLSKENGLAAYDFPNGSWGNEMQIPFDVVKTSTAIPGLAQTGFYLIDQGGKIYSYQAETQRLVSQVGAWDFANKEVINFRNQNLILKTNGKIYLQAGQTLEPWAPAEGTYTDLVAVPLYDSFQVVRE